MAGKTCDECGYPIAACNEITLLKMEVKRLRKALQQIADDPYMDPEGNSQHCLKALGHEA